MQQGDVEETFADIDDLSKITGFSPKTTLSNGLGKFVDWYKKYYEIK
jgi:UDP-glucuronate 4-epimerase